jgi:hypothetical protein
VSLPLETMSTVAAILARTAGGRKRLLVTIRPRPRRSFGNRVGLTPDAQDVGVGDLRGAGFQPEGDGRGRACHQRRRDAGLSAVVAIARAFINLADIAHTLADEIEPIHSPTSPHA